MCSVKIQREQNLPLLFVISNVFSEPGFAVATKPPLTNLCCVYITGEPD